MKKKLAILTAALMLATTGTAFVGCDDDSNSQEKTVMNLSLNPKVEFVLDSENKVVSVNALNEEGNVILSGEVFVALSAEDAAKLFVETAKETGFLVEGNIGVDNTEISVSFSGEDVAALYNEVKGEIDSYLSEENITATVTQAAAITKAQLEAQVQACYPYIEAAKIQAMEQAELVEQLYESRKETVEFHSQELKNAYYEAKANVMRQAEFEVLKSQLNSIEQAALDFTYGLYTSAVDALEEGRKGLCAGYQAALEELQEAKVRYLKERERLNAMEASTVTEQMKQVLEDYAALVTQAETALETVKTTAMSALATLETSVNTTYQAVVSAIEGYSVKASDHLSAISDKQKELQTQFFNDFETGYAAHITAAKNSWAAMKTQLETAE